MSDLSKIPFDNTPGGFGMYLRPRCCCDTLDAIEPVIVLGSKNSICEKIVHFLCLECRNFFSFFLRLNSIFI